MTEIPPYLIEALRVAAAEVDKFGVIVKDLRAAIEELLGEDEYATVDGQAVVQWSHVQSRRLDQSKLKAAVDPATLAACYTESTSRRFLVLKP